MNKLNFYKPVDRSRLPYGLSVLHVSYNNRFEGRIRWSVKAIKDKLGLIVDVSKQGYGTSITGNAARSFIQKLEEAHEAIGFSKNFLIRFAVILSALSSGRKN
ncbi:hypothetical protein PR048_017178 [Dryococelus australis]|uniref:Uncharacterized protein n=1 Tax=Dryococelus australis TaxID=614101 RepID=A0ABQ9H8T4_9NEOP|nr:hypothetical protein PR048_017178 [Dryococelus australis]